MPSKVIRTAFASLNGESVSLIMRWPEPPFVEPLPPELPPPEPLPSEPDDWVEVGPLGVVDSIEKRLNTVKGGDIVLMHDGQNKHNRPDQLLQILPLFLRKLADRGLHPALLPA